MEPFRRCRRFVPYHVAIQISYANLFLRDEATPIRRCPRLAPNAILVLSDVMIVLRRDMSLSAEWFNIIVLLRTHQLLYLTDWYGQPEPDLPGGHTELFLSGLIPFQIEPNNFRFRPRFTGSRIENSARSPFYPILAGPLGRIIF